MILAIDMGNTNIVIGGIDSECVYFEERITTDHSKTAMEYAITMKNILEIHDIKAEQIEGAILSSVVPPLNAPLASAVKKILGFRPIIVSSETHTGLQILTDNPKAVGADLIVDAVAALYEYPAPIIIIDMGTATTITVVDHTGSYLGGCILPGLRVSLDSLSSKTAQLPHISLDIPEKVIGRNTIDSMRSGIMYGSAGMIDGILEHMEEELGEKATIVATGGLSRFIVPLCKHEIIYDEALLLKGLYILYEKNKSTAL